MSKFGGSKTDVVRRACEWVERIYGRRPAVEEAKKKNFGKELILDLHDCDPLFFSKKEIERFFVQLGELTEMELSNRYWWTTEDLPKEYREIPHLKGITAVQFVTTSNFTIHTLPILRRVYLNIFTCKDFDAPSAAAFAANFFQGRIVSCTILERV